MKSVRTFPLQPAKARLLNFNTLVWDVNLRAKESKVSAIITLMPLLWLPQFATRQSEWCPYLRKEN